MIKDVEHLFMWSLATCISSSKKCLFNPLPIWLFVFCCGGDGWVVGVLYMFWILTLYHRYALQIFPPLPQVTFSSQCAFCLTDLSHLAWQSALWGHWQHLSCSLLYSPSVWLLEEVMERTWPLDDQTAGPSNWRLLTPPPPWPPLPPSWECTFCPPFPQWELVSRRQPWQSKVLLRPSGQCTWLNPFKASLYVKILAGAGRDLAAPKTSLVGRFSCLLDLPPTNLEWPACFSGLFLPFVY